MPEHSPVNTNRHRTNSTSMPNQSATATLRPVILP